MRVSTAAALRCEPIAAEPLVEWTVPAATVLVGELDELPQREHPGESVGVPAHEGCDVRCLHREHQVGGIDDGVVRAAGAVPGEVEALA